MMLFQFLLAASISVSILPVMAGGLDEVSTVIQEPFPPYDSELDTQGYNKPAFFQISADRSLAVLGTPLNLHIYDLQTRRLIRALQYPWPTFFGASALDPSGRFLVYSTRTAPDYSPYWKLHEVATGKEIDIGGSSEVWNEKTSDIEVAPPVTVSTTKLSPQDPWQITVDARRAIFQRGAEQHRVTFLPKPEPPFCRQFADGTTLHWSGGDEIEVADTANHRIRLPLIPNPDLRVLGSEALSAVLRRTKDGSLLAIALDRGEVFVIDVRTDRLVFRGGGSAFAVDDKACHIAILEAKSRISVYEIRSGVRVNGLRAGNPFNISGDGSHVAAWDATEKRVVHLPVHAETPKRFALLSRSNTNAAPGALALNADGTMLAIADWQPMDGAPLRVVDTRKGETVASVKDAIGPLIFDAPGKFLAFSRYRGHFSAEIGLLNVARSAVVYRSEEFAISGYHPDDITFGTRGKSLWIPNGAGGLLRFDLGDTEGRAQVVLSGQFRHRIGFCGDHGVVNSYSGEMVLFDPGKPDVETLRLFPLNNGHVVAVTPEYVYAGMPGSLDAIAFRRGSDALPVDQFDVPMNRPHEIMRILGAPEERIALLRRAYEKRLRLQGFSAASWEASSVLPEISVTNRQTMPLATTKSELEFEFEAADAWQPLHRINVFVNDVPIAGRNGIPLRDAAVSSHRGRLAIKLSRGPNKIELSATNARGVESIRETHYVTRVAGETETPDLYVLAVGVSDYRQDDLDLTVAAKDAREFSAVMETLRKEEFATIHTRKILDSEATRENILAAQSFLRQSRVDDQVVIFIAGHGFQDTNDDYWFGTHDIDERNPADRGLGYEELEGLFDGVEARQRLLLMDTCFAGEVDPDERKLAANGKQISRGVTVRAPRMAARSNVSATMQSLTILGQFFADFRRRTGATVLTASGGVEFVYAEENEDLGNGAFSYALMQGLKTGSADINHDGAVHLSEWRTDAFERVSKLTEGRQRPSGREINRELDFVVGRIFHKLPALPPKWTMLEEVTDAQGNWRIEWNLNLTTNSGGVIQLTGNKARVNGKAATSGERRTTLHLNLGIQGLKAEGVSLETNWKGGEIRGKLKIEFDASLQSFHGQLLETQGRASKISGSAVRQ